jgi:hypothetical protein
MHPGSIGQCRGLVRKHDPSDQLFSRMLATERETVAFLWQTVQSYGEEEYRKEIPEPPETAPSLDLSNAYDDGYS